MNWYKAVKDAATLCVRGVYTLGEPWVYTTPLFDTEMCTGGKNIFCPAPFYDYGRVNADYCYCSQTEACLR